MLLRKKSVFIFLFCMIGCTSPMINYTLDDTKSGLNERYKDRINNVNLYNLKLSIQPFTDERKSKSDLLPEFTSKGREHLDQGPYSSCDNSMFYYTLNDQLKCHNDLFIKKICNELAKRLQS